MGYGKRDPFCGVRVRGSVGRQWCAVACQVQTGRRHLKCVEPGPPILQLNAWLMAVVQDCGSVGEKECASLPLLWCVTCVCVAPAA